MSTAPVRHKATLIAKTQLSSKFILGRFRLGESETMNFTAGQHIMWYIAPGINRSMSLASPQAWLPEFEICHDVSPMGPGSRWMLALTAGDEVEFMGPLGVFTLDKESSRPKFFIATGSGIAPFRAMILDYLEGLPARQSPITLYWGLRSPQDVFWQQEFSELSSKYPNFRFILTLSQPDGSWQGKSGRVTAHLEEIANPPGNDYYLCGNKNMVEEVSQWLLGQNVPKPQIKTELFY